MNHQLKPNFKFNSANCGRISSYASSLQGTNKKRQIRLQTDEQQITQRLQKDLQQHYQIGSKHEKLLFKTVQIIFVFQVYQTPAKNKEIKLRFIGLICKQLKIIKKRNENLVIQLNAFLVSLQCHQQFVFDQLIQVIQQIRKAKMNCLLQLIPTIHNIQMPQPRSGQKKLSLDLEGLKLFYLKSLLKVISYFFP
ncbi:unnamed protein product [Paramecium octaurelia]|uniref:Uncharacterized protein n=1 Tax=Paramecium octaurelia TaxID=43137 RepID=A0A8S1Y351_PAROT|nr:unnamed protein product [Paramecium octaurelia]